MEVKVQLKVCEGCGCLWFRAQQQGVYCSGCEVKLAEFPAPETRKRRGRQPGHRAGRAWMLGQAAGGAE
jgi:uncharacterized Zn finger protein (UPF0148 family)